MKNKKTNTVETRSNFVKDMINEICFLFRALILNFAGVGHIENIISKNKDLRFTNLAIERYLELHPMKQRVTILRKIIDVAVVQEQVLEAQRCLLAKDNLVSTSLMFLVLHGFNTEIKQSAFERLKTRSDISTDQYFSIFFAHGRLFHTGLEEAGPYAQEMILTLLERERNVKKKITASEIMVTKGGSKNARKRAFEILLSIKERLDDEHIERYLSNPEFFISHSLRNELMDEHERRIQERLTETDEDEEE